MTALLNPRIIALVTVPVMALMFAVLLLMAEAGYQSRVAYYADVTPCWPYELVPYSPLQCERWPDVSHR